MIAINYVHALKAQLFRFTPATVFAVLDGAAVPDLLPTLASYSTEHYCLFRGELEADMAEVAPYLAVLEPEAPFTQWLLQNGWGMNWGVFGVSHAGGPRLKRHFRTFVQVYCDLQPLYFRYYDPRVMRNFLPTCTEGELRTLFGPVIRFVVEDSSSHVVRSFSFSGKDLLEERTPLQVAAGNDISSVRLACRSGEAVPDTGYLVVRPEQLRMLGERIYVERMRGYLNEFFPDSMAVPIDEMDRAIVELTDRAAGYKLILETHVAPFIVAAWIFGKQFDEEFLAVKEVLEDYEMDCGLKAQWLWDFIDTSVGILEGGVAKNE